jgi:tetratricopeptide (TPR) repeat protein
MAWEARPIFVSSTFADMQAERDHLRTHVFPALEERLRSRRRHLEWVDLRLGVVAASYQDAEMRELQVLKVCLGEVQRCRPFLIVLLGDRYGWVPPPERIAAAAREVGFDESISGRSVTDLEIQSGILSDTEHQPRSFFYFRQPLPYADMPLDVAAAYADAYGTDPDAAGRSKRLAALKGEIEARLPKRIRRYAAGWDSERQCVTGLDVWGQTVLEDIWSEILATTASPESEAKISWRQAERNSLDDYIEDRTRDFVGRGKVLSRLLELASSPTQERTPWGVCLTAPPGSGKSAIFGEMRRRLKLNGVFVLAHAAAASARALSVDDMLRRWIEELGAALGIDSGLADDADADTIDATFQALLGRMATERRIVVLVDALDQFEATTRGRFITWLPRLWPANARLIATAVPCEASKTLETRTGMEPLTLPALDADEARRIAEAICTRYHRTLEPEVLNALLAKQGEANPAWSNTLWLVLAVEELNLVDGDDFGRAMRTYTGSTAEQLCALMLDIVAELPTDVHSLYAESFERAEKLFGASLAQAFLGFIAISRAGWRESDFRMLLPRASGEKWDELRFASLRRLFRGQIRQRGAMGQWDFNHAQMRAAVCQYLAGKRVAESKLHGWAAQHQLVSLSSDDPLRQSETMVHLLGSKDWLLAAEFYGGASLSQPEREGATRVLADAILTLRQAGEMTGLDQVLNILRAVGQISDDRAAVIAGNVAERLQSYLGPMLAEHGELGSRATLLEAIRKTFNWLVRADPANTRWQHNLSLTQSSIGDLRVAQGRLSEALASYRESRDIDEHLTKVDRTNPGWWQNLFVARGKIGDVLNAQGQISEALTTYRQIEEMLERFLKAYPDNAAWQENLSTVLKKIGNVLIHQGQLAEALTCFRQGRDIAERLAKADPGNAVLLDSLSSAQSGIGDVQVTLGDLSEALASFRQSLDIADRLAKADPVNAGLQHSLSFALIKIGEVQAAQGQLTEALSSYYRSRDIRECLTKADPLNAEWQQNLSLVLLKIGDVLCKQGQLSAAFRSYSQCRDIRERLAKADPGNAEWQHTLSVSLINIGNVQVAQGRLSEALSSYRQGRDIFERLAKVDPTNAAWQLDLAVAFLLKTGDVQAAQGHLSEALSSYRQGRDIAMRFAKVDPTNAKWQYNLAIALLTTGDVEKALGQLPEALSSYRQSWDILERIAKADPANATWQRELSISLQRIGDVHTAHGQLSDARSSYRQSRDIFERLAKADPANAGWQRDLSVALLGMADVLRNQGQLSEALSNYRQSRDIFERLAKVDPANAGWRRNLAASLQRIGDVHVAQGRLSEALSSYRGSRDIFERLAKVDPANAGWQHDLATAYTNVGAVQKDQGDLGGALESFKASHVIRKRLTDIAPNNAEWQSGLAGTHWKLAFLAQDPFENCRRVVEILSALERAGRLAPKDKPLMKKARDHLKKVERMVKPQQQAGGDMPLMSGDLSAALAVYQTTGAANHVIASGDKTFNVHIVEVGPISGVGRKVEGNDTDAQHDSGVSQIKTGDARSLEDRLSAALDQAGRALFQSRAKLDPSHAELRLGDLERFQADVNERLLAMGWTRGRDISAELDDWLVPRVVELSEKFSEQNGLPPYAPPAAAVAVMREFGGLVSRDNGPGQTMAQLPFVIYPAPHGELISFAPDVQELGETIGSPAFQVGEVERGMGALVVDELGRVFLAGPVQLYAGANIDEALTRMLRGIYCEQLSEVGL